MQEERKIFGVGMNKTGTSSLKQCFEALGIVPIPSQQEISAARAIISILRKNNYEPALNLAQKYRAFEDRPWNIWKMYRKLDERFPGSQFVLTVRDPETWWRSVERWLTVVKPGSRQRYMLHLGVDTFSKDAFIKGYERYNREVTGYFGGRAGDFLVMDFEGGDGWEKLCSFLGRNTPLHLPVPHTNRQRYGGENEEEEADPGDLTELVKCFACGYAREEKKAERPRRSKVRRVWARVNRKLRVARDERVQRRGRDQRKDREKLKRLQARMPSLRIDNLAAVCCFFNPLNSQRRLVNYHLFNQSIRKSGIPLLTVELAFGDLPHQLFDVYGDVMQVRSDDVMWQKERLLNLGIGRLLDRGFEKIAWLDADVVFMDAENWPWHVAAALESSTLCQVFEALLLHKGELEPTRFGVSAVKYYQDNGVLDPQPSLPRSPRRPWRYPRAVTGYGWAANTALLKKVPLYDAAVVGGADKMMFLASHGGGGDDAWHERMMQLVRSSKGLCPSCGHQSASPSYARHYLEWARRWAAAVNNRVGYANLTIHDLYHGPHQARRYQERKEILLNYAFDPTADLHLNSDGCWKWSSEKQGMHSSINRYFLARQEG